MLFTGPTFLFLFLPVVLAVYFATPTRARNAVLLGASLFFYAWGETIYVVVLLTSIFANYLGGLAIAGARGKAGRRMLLWLFIGGDLSLLALFKYSAFAVQNLDRLLSLLRFPSLPVPTFHLPIGVSFFTFMGMSYLADIYRGQLEPEKKLGRFALYIALFPHLVAGPIIRFSQISAELIERYTTRPFFAYGVKRFVFGLGKKVLIANILATTVNNIFTEQPAHITTGMAWLGALCFTLQIYFDFSGYTDMAIGLAAMFGFHFPENFEYPYTSQSISEFWRRWHITLSTWFRDYVFFPLSYRRSKRRMLLNLLFVFALCGFWHGASWTFVVWGLAHGSFLVLERAGLDSLLMRLPRFVRHLYVMLVVIGTFVLFRAGSISQAAVFFRAMIGMHNVGDRAYGLGLYINPEMILALLAAVIFCTPVWKWLQSVPPSAARTRPFAEIAWISGVKLFAEVATIGLIFTASVALSATGTYTPFIYFRF